MRYALLSGEEVAAVVVWDGVTEWTAPAGLTPVQVPDGQDCSPGWSYDGSNWTPAPEVQPTLDWDGIRSRRDELLAASDWTQVADAPVDAAAWAAYRQALRDIPQDYATPDEVVWPTPPA